MLTGRTFRLYPKEQQAGILSRWIGCQRVIRYAKIEETRLNSWLLRYSKFSNRPGNKLPAYVEAEENPLQAWLLRYSKFSARPGNENEKFHDNFPLFDQAYSHFKKEQNPCLREVPSQILRNAVARAKAGFVNYWTRPGQSSPGQGPAK